MKNTQVSKIIRATAKIILAISILSLSQGCVQKQSPYHTESNLIMGTVVEITCQDRQAIHAAFSEMEHIERLLSIYDATSEISQLNKKRKITASWKTIQLIKKSKTLNTLTRGAFDITVGPLTQIWKKAIEEEALPHKSSVKKAKNLVNAQGIEINEILMKISLSKSGIQLDLGAIAKGFAVDVAIKKLRELGITSCLINAGGDIYCLGKKYDTNWQVGIKHPRAQKTVKTLSLANRAIATSGDYEQFFTLQGKRYSHIIDPHTGYPADSGVVSVTVIADDCLTADALATSIVVLGKTEGEALMKEFPEVEAIIITKEDLD
ncbi:FAD:protein FMN transferase, partial [Candidatus Omnitrophota bacterium]